MHQVSRRQIVGEFFMKIKSFILILGVFSLFMGCASKPAVFKIDDFVWPKESANPKIKAVRVITNSAEFPKKEGGKSVFLKELVGDVNVKWIDNRAIRLTSDGKGKVYIATPIGKLIQIIDFVKQDIKELRFGGIMPAAVDVSEDGRMFIINRASGSVMEITEDKKVLWSYGKIVDEKDFEKMKKDENFDDTGLYKDLTDICYYKGKVYVTDQLFGKIDVFTADGKMVKSIKKVPAPVSITINKRTDDIYVVSKFVGKVFVYDQDGNMKKELLEPGDNIWALNFPNGIALDSEGHIYVVDIASNGFKIYDEKGTFLYYMGEQKPSVYLGGFNNPKDIFVDDNDRIYVLDGPNRRLVILQYLSELYKNGKRDMTQEEPMLRW